jgi:hypothetical protein
MHDRTALDWLLFGHLIGITALVAANGIDIFAKAGLLRARTVQEQRWLLRMDAVVPKITPAATVALFGCGMGLVLDSHSDLNFGLAWIVMGIVIVVAMIVIEPGITARRQNRLEVALRDAPDGPADPKLIALAHEPVMHMCHRFGVISTVELFYVMTLKPAMGLTLVSAAVMLAVTGAVSVPLWRSASRLTVPVNYLEGA